MEIVPATTEEVDEVADLWVDLAREQRAFGSHLRPDENRTTIRDSLARHAIAEGLLVARTEDGDLAGFIMFSPEAGAFEQDVDRGTVENLYVKPAERDRGIGAALLEAAESRLFAAGVDVVTLEAMAANEGALRFYERHGYRPHRVELEKRPGEGSDGSDTHTREDTES